MNARHWALVTLLAVLWGSSFLMAEIALKALAPFTIVFFRIGTAAVLLCITLRVRGMWLGVIWQRRRKYIVLAFFGSAFPFAGFSWGQQYIDSSLAGVLNSTRTAGKIIDQGMTPVAHVAARNIADENELERIVAGFTGVGVHEFLLLGGGEATPAGKFENSMQLLQTGIFQHYNARKVGFAGHPEEHPAQPRDIMRQALLDKLRYASAHDMEAFIVTQFCFAVTPYFDFLDWLKSEKISVPVRLGIAGRVGAKKLFKYAAFCGIGRSVGFFRRQFGKTLGLVNFSPEGIIAELAGRVAVRQYDFPISLHFYPFGAVRETLAVISEAQINGVAEVA